MKFSIIHNLKIKNLDDQLFQKCSHGKKQNDYICSFAKLGKNKKLNCLAMLGYCRNIKVQGLETCFLSARNELKLKIVNNRNKSK